LSESVLHFHTLPAFARRWNCAEATEATSGGGGRTRRTRPAGRGGGAVLPREAEAERVRSVEESPRSINFPEKKCGIGQPPPVRPGGRARGGHGCRAEEGGSW
jgi:hypothetical protein